METASEGVTRFAFSDVVLDTAALELTRDGVRVHVQPQVFDVLVHLLRHRDRVVSKEELLDAVWGDRYVSESALTSRIKSAREAVGDDGRRQAVIRTAHGRGYQFVATVTAHGVPEQPRVSPRNPGPAVGPGIADPPRQLVDRRELQATIAGTLHEARQVTLVGPAGVGKTLLAHHVAASVQASFPDGAWLVPLADTRHPDDVAQAVLDALGAQRFPSGTAVDTLVHRLGPASALLVLDNCEHVLDGVADLVTRLLAAGGPLVVLATSRQRLDVPGEVTIPVPVLDPTDGVELFLRRAAEQGMGDVETSPAVSELCRALDQLPLAIELACAQARVLGIDQLVALLDSRLELLTGWRGAGRTHVSLQGAIATSFDQLAPPLQETLGRLGQFAGWFDLPAATDVAATGRDLERIEAVRHVVALAEHSLLEVETTGTSTRYRLLESIRLFAAARLQDPEVARRAHVRCYRVRAAEQARQLAGPEFESGWQAVRADWTNHRAAVRHALGLGMTEDVIAILNATADYAELSLAFEHGDWAEAVLGDVGEQDTPAVREARAGWARLLAPERRLDEQAVQTRLAGDPTQGYSVALAHFWRAGAVGDLERLREYFGLLVHHTAGTGGLRELTVGVIAHMIARRTGIDPTDAGNRARRIGRASGEVGRAFARVIDAYQAMDEGDTDTALAACTEAADLACTQSLEVLGSLAQALRVMAVHRHDDLELVGTWALAAMRHYRQRGHWSAARNDVPVVCRVIAGAGRPRVAADLLAGYRPLRYRSVEPSYLNDVRASVGLEPAVDTPLADDITDVASARYCDHVVVELEDALRILRGGSDGT